MILFDLPVSPTNVRFVGGAGNDRLETRSEPATQNFVLLDEQLSVTGEQAMEFTEDDAVEAFVGSYRITSNWEPSTSYLARDAFFSAETLSWQPNSGHFLTELNEETQNWASMKWTLELVSPGEYRIRCQWGSETGYLTRRGEQDAFGTWHPSPGVLVTSLHPEWSSQRWSLIPTGDGGNLLINMWGPSDGVLTRNSGGRNEQGQYIPGDFVQFYPLEDWSSQVWNLNSAD